MNGKKGKVLSSVTHKIHFFPECDAIERKRAIFCIDDPERLKELVIF